MNFKDPRETRIKKKLQLMGDLNILGEMFCEVNLLSKVKPRLEI